MTKKINEVFSKKRDEIKGQLIRTNKEIDKVRSQLRFKNNANITDRLNAALRNFSTEKNQLINQYVTFSKQILRKKYTKNDLTAFENELKRIDQTLSYYSDFLSTMPSSIADTASIVRELEKQKAQVLKEMAACPKPLPAPAGIKEKKRKLKAA